MSKIKVDIVTPLDRDGQPIEKPKGDWSDVASVRRESWITLEEAKRRFPDAKLPNDGPEDIELDWV